MDESNIHEMSPEDRVVFAFEMIRSAATILSAFPYAEAAESLRRQEASAWFTDPVTMAVGTSDLALKLRLLDAAAVFIAEWKAVEVAAVLALMETDDD